MERRRLMFMGLAGALAATLGLPAAAQAGILGDTTGLGRAPAPEADAFRAHQPGAPEEGVQLAQHFGPPPRHHRRRPRCWNETRRIRYRDRWGRVRYRHVTERVCR